CDNETNRKRLYNIENHKKYPKDGINDYIVHGDKAHVNPKKTGTKAAALYRFTIPPGEAREVSFRMRHPFPDGEDKSNEEILAQRRNDAEEYYEELQKDVTDKDLRNIQRQAYAGMLWGKQFY